MKLKKLNLIGFKSFLDKHQIIFSEGISGIVGPNGCGKSNIVDAIRWCMGEQSPKQLRGRKMEDIIFGGAGEQKPLGMAEVSLYFENGDGSFPEPFAHDEELSVTRRLFRSGESEYLINNVPCRLKDIQEVFMDTGLGNKAYSIIGQGQIGTIIEQKPEETRVMLEEAAGITKYRKKVQASQRKIELTEANLQRVEDILSEVERQMRSLKRQSAKAQRYKKIGDEIRNLELVLYANTYDRLKGELTTKMTSADELVQEELAKNTSLSRVHAAIETMNLALDEKDAGLSELRKAYLQLREEVHKKEAGLESLAGEIRMQEALERRLREENETLDRRIVELKEEKESIGENIEKLGERCGAMEGEMALAEKRVATRRHMLKDIKIDYEKAREILNDGTNRETGLNHESGYLNKTLNQISDSRSRLQKELEEARVKMEEVGRASERKTVVRQETLERLREIDEAMDRERTARDELVQIQKNVERDLKTGETALNQVQSRLSGLRTLTENFEGYKVGVRTIMRAKDLQPRREGHILGLVADVIQVDSRHEQAVEAVLADKVQYIIVDSQQDGKEAVNYLKKRERGRSSFVPLKNLNDNGGLPREGGRFPRMSTLVSAPEAYQSLVDTLLGDAVLVENLEQALSAWNGNGKNTCFVTPEGDMVDQRGVISGGKTARSSGGLLARKREMRELEEDSGRHQQEVSLLKEKVEATSWEIEEKTQHLAALSEQRGTRQDEINELDKLLFRFGQELDQLDKLTQRVSEDLQRKEREQARHRDELLRIQDELERCKERRRQEEAYFREKEAELKECETEYDRFRDEMARLKADSGILKEEQRSLKRELERLDAYMEESLKRQEKIDQDMTHGLGRREECRSRMGALRDELDFLYEKLQVSEEKVNRADQDRQAFHNRIKEEEHRTEKLRGEIDDLKEKINLTRMEHSEIRFKMNNLEEKARERADLKLSDIYESHLDENFSEADVASKLEHKRNLRQKLGEVNLTAIKEHEALKERHEFIKSQREDLMRSIEDLQLAIRRINKTSLEKFRETIQEVDKKIKEIFPILFRGGTAGLRLSDETKPLESGVLVEVQPPGKKLSHMGLLSGGEKALVAMAFLFAIYMIRPSPFCLLDEVDAPLDEANIDRFNNLLGEIRRFSQIIMVTHSRRTMEIVDRLYGVTMEKAGVSKTVTVDIRKLREETREAA